MKQLRREVQRRLRHSYWKYLNNIFTGFLREGGYSRTYQCFLKECIHLREYESLLKKGQEYPTNIMGLSLLMMLEEYAKLKLTHSLINRDLSSLPSTSRNKSSRASVQTGQSMRTVSQRYRTKGLSRNRKGLPSRDGSQSVAERIRNAADHCSSGLSTNIVPACLFETSSSSSEDSLELDVGDDAQEPEAPCTSTPAGRRGAGGLGSVAHSISDGTPVSCVSSSISNTSGFHSDTPLQVHARQSESRESRGASRGVGEPRAISGARQSGRAERLYGERTDGATETSASSGGGAREFQTAGQTR
ncbi:hypothetical protein ACOMHN_019123 [Nucella lapillus]